MSKAFTREDDDAAEPTARVRVSVLPPGAPNYATPEGAARLKADATALAARRSELVHAGPEARRELADVDERLRLVREHLALLEVVDPAAQDPTRVFFGATVTLVDDDGHETVYRIVGVDEADVARGRVSWLAPIARAMVGKRVGDPVVLPSREHREIASIAYVRS